MDNPDQLITPQEACKRLGVTPSTLARWADRGLLPCVRTLGGNRRFKAGDIAAAAAGKPAPGSGDEDPSTPR